ncbi:hypothetical protein [Geomesophilobacter sediminis]|uniref:Uncharacterized protein n=1 Tax=Geomesophilobacter sediminis TaxID=2798584 RepID=A0A8J7LXN0_9BACT|nr:hypothetical protein [Geomesophilobacter sediminis]MBJ6723442.1 hypothetical protein [Geomesophilobacter sediminis]
MANDQYRELREKLAETDDIAEKNLIFRRLINLLDVMQYLNTGHSDTYAE